MSLSRSYLALTDKTAYETINYYNPQINQLNDTQDISNKKFDELRSIIVKAQNTVTNIDDSKKRLTDKKREHPPLSVIRTEAETHAKNLNTLFSTLEHEVKNFQKTQAT